MAVGCQIADKKAFQDFRNSGYVIVIWIRVLTDPSGCSERWSLLLLLPMILKNISPAG